MHEEEVDEAGEVADSERSSYAAERTSDEIEQAKAVKAAAEEASPTRPEPYPNPSLSPRGVFPDAYNPD